MMQLRTIKISMIETISLLLKVPTKLLLPRHTNMRFVAQVPCPKRVRHLDMIFNGIKYELYEAHVSSYEKHPEQGLRAVKKKLQKDPKNVVLLVGLPQLFFLPPTIITHGILACSDSISTTPCTRSRCFG